MVAAKQHPLMYKNKITLADYKEAKFFITSHIGGRPFVESKKTLSKFFLTEQKIIVIPHIITILDLLAENDDFVSIIPRRYFACFNKNYDLTFRGLPFDSPKICMYQFWPKCLDSDPGLQWILSQIRVAVNQPIL